MAWCTAEDIELRAGSRYSDALPPGDDGSFVTTVITQAAAYIAGRLAPRYSLDGVTDPGDAVLQGLCADEAFYRLMTYRAAGDVIEGSSVLASLKRQIEETLKLIAEGKMRLSIGEYEPTRSDLRTERRLIIKGPRGWD